MAYQAITNEEYEEYDYTDGAVNQHVYDYHNSTIVHKDGNYSPAVYRGNPDKHVDDWCLTITDTAFRQYMDKLSKDENDRFIPSNMPF